MSTIVPLEWTTFFADGTIFSSWQGFWSEFSDLVQVGGVDLSLSRMPIREVRIFHQDTCHSLLLGMPQSCFAFHRWQSLSNQQATWLYSCFGYTQDHLRITLSLSSNGARTRVEHANLPFSL